MKVYGLWHGGANYSHGDARDIEEFPSLKSARQAMESRAESGYWERQDMNFIARPAESVLCPAVDGDSMTVWFYNPIVVDDSGRAEWVSSDPYPDRRLERGPRGAIVTTLA